MNIKINIERFFENKPDRPECDTCRYHKMCRQRVEQWNKAVNEYPNACPKCCGTGFISFTENGAPHGAGYWPMEMQEACECIESDRCPRCGGELVWKDDDYEIGYCSSCNIQIADEAMDPVIPYDKPYCVYPTVYEIYGDTHPSLTVQERNPGFRSW